MYQRVLILAPHIDDAELGCGGTIARFMDEGKDVFLVSFSPAVKSLPESFAPDSLLREQLDSAFMLGLPEKNIIVFNFEARNFPAFRQDVLEQMIMLRREIKPELVLLPAPEDIHQDHRTITEEGIRAFKLVSLFGYELPWNNLSFNSNGFVILNEGHVQKKSAALKCFKSQQHRIYFQGDLIYSIARLRGAQAGAAFAEMFNVIRLMWLR